MSVLAWSVTGVVLLVAIVTLYHFNRMVTLRNRCRESWANVDTELQRRYDLVPNLVETVKGYAAHEASVLRAVTEARAHALAAQGPVGKQARYEGMLVEALKTLFAVVEGYPELKASRNFLALQEELAITEDRLQAARRFYNGNVRDYRDITRAFPGFLFARWFGFGDIDMFQVEPAVRHVPAVSFTATAEVGSAA